MIALDKPLAELYLLDECFSPYGMPFELPNETVLTFENIDPNNVTLILHQGEIAISRKFNNVLLGIAKAPFIKGLSTGLIQRPSEYIYTAHIICLQI